MCNNPLVRAPTWQGLTPGLPSWVPASEDVVVQELRQAGLNGDLSVMKTDGTPEGYYRLERAGEQTLFVKRLAAQWAESVLRAEAIATWLAEHDVSVTVPLAGFPKQLPGGDILCVSPFIVGRRLLADSESLECLGKSLAHLHSVLASHPHKNTWSDATGRRLEALMETRQGLAAGKIIAGPDPDRLAALAAERNLDFWLPNMSRQPLHGDLNPGNVLFDGSDLYFLDFEDCFHSVLPSIFELVLAIERFVLVPLLDDSAAQTVGQCMIVGYKNAGGIIEMSNPSQTLRSLSLRSLCVLAEAAQRGVSVPDAEWSKFFDLEAQASARSKTINAIFQDIAA